VIENSTPGGNAAGRGGDGPGSGPPSKVGTGGIVVMTVLGTVAGLVWGPFLGLGYGALVTPAKGYSCIGVIPDENSINLGLLLGLFAGPLAMGFLFHWMAVRGVREARDPVAPRGWLRGNILPPMKAPRLLQLGLVLVTLGACAGMVFPGGQEPVGHCLILPTSIGDVGDAKTLEVALQRVSAARPPWKVVDHVVQDEYSHDVILAVNGIPVSSADDVRSSIGAVKEGGDLRLRVLRGGKAEEIAGTR
jgi:hypothetical protein